VRYTAAVDASGGGPAAFTFAVVHVEGEGEARKVVQDVMRGWSRKGSEAPDLVDIVKDIAATLKSYGLDEVTGDKYGGAWVTQAFRDAGVTYRAAALDASEAYVECQPLFAREAIAILDHPVLVRELKALEQRALPSGKVKIDAPRRENDDHANALALIAALAVGEGGEGLKILNVLMGNPKISVDEQQRMQDEDDERAREISSEAIERVCKSNGVWWPR